MNHTHDTEPTHAAPLPWKVAVVDDDPEIHQLVGRLLSRFFFQGRGITLFTAHSGQEARTLVRQQPDLAALLLDVIMETEQAGLDLVRYVRQDLHNHFVRIILHTGQASQFPEMEISAGYDINDYLDKSTLDPHKLATALTLALRGYQDLRTLAALSLSNQELESRVAERTEALLQANRELEKQRQSLVLSQEIAQLGNWDWDLTNDDFSWSQEIHRIFGLPPTDTHPSFDRFLRAIHDEDREHLQVVLARALNENQPFQLEHRVVRPNGDVRVVRQLGRVNRDEAGRPLRLVGTVHDITEMRSAEDRLAIATRIFGSAMEEATERLNLTTLVLENAIEGVMVTDIWGVIQSVNTAFVEISGYTREEAIGRSAMALRSDRHEQAFYDAMWRSMRRNGRWRGEIWNRRKNGEAYPALLTITAIKDREDHPSHYVYVFHDLTSVKQSQEALQYRTYHDALTDLPNRELFKDRLAQAIRHAHRSGARVAVLTFDLDLFCQVNSSLGHAVGDLVLQEVALRFRDLVREGDTISRLGGDMFAFLLREVDQLRDVMQVARKLMTAFQQPYLILERELVIKASAGIAIYPADGDDAGSLLQNAEIALTRAKKAGRDNFQYYTPGMAEQAARRLAMENDLRKALEREEFVLYFQPKVDIQAGQIIGMETLVRWNHPQAGLLLPGEFIGVAEETGLIVPLGEWVLRNACLQTKKWIDEGHATLRVAVNLSARQFRRKDILDTVANALQESGLPPERLELEITESMLVENVEEAIEILCGLKEMGLTISLDDFGTGYSSLNYLRRFPINALKIDRSFIRNLPGDSEGATIVSAIISLARDLNLKVVAEGVETLEHMSFLRSKRCDEVQGFLLSRPIPPEEFVALLKKGLGGHDG